MKDIDKAKEFILNKLRLELPGNLYYHSLKHTMDVLEAALKFAELENLNNHEIILLQTAVLFHDSGFTVQSKDHEEIGCQIASQYLPEFGYSTVEIEMINGMIMATKIPQNPKNIMEAIICDADLDYLGRDDFWAIGNNLFEELKIYGILSNEQDWNQLQLKFLENHHYFTASAIKLRKDQKDLHTSKIREIVKTYQD